jgi:hypothetical protein
LSTYDDLLQKAREVAEQLRSTAKEFIPKMYAALRRENSNISASDARDRIQRDCVQIWSKRTILDALPDDAKNPEKQKAARLRQKQHNSAAFAAAPTNKRKVMIASMQGPIEHNEQIRQITNVETNYVNHLVEGYKQDSGGVLQEEGITKKQETANKQECPRCEELQCKVRDYEEALSHVPFLAADQIGKSTLKYQIPKDRHYILEQAMCRCSHMYEVTFDITGKLVSAEPDITVLE